MTLSGRLPGGGKGLIGGDGGGLLVDDDGEKANVSSATALRGGEEISREISFSSWFML